MKHLKNIVIAALSCGALCSFNEGESLLPNLCGIACFAAILAIIHTTEKA